MLKQILALLLVLALTLTGVMVSAPSVSGTVADAGSDIDYSLDGAVYVNFDGDTVNSTGGYSTYAVTGTTLSIAAGGVYVLSGKSSSANVAVLDDVTSNVTIVMNGLELSCASTAPMVFGRNTNVTLISAAGSVNVISDSDRDQDKPKSAISSEGNINIAGEGSLTVNGSNKNGIKADGDLIISGSALNVTAADDGICADNILQIDGGNITVSAGGHGLKTSPDAVTDEKQGVFRMNGGTVNITVQGEGDGIHSAGDAYVSEGTVVITSDDDGIHSGANLYIGEDGADDSLLNIDILKSYEGLEGIEIYIYSGNVNIVSDDDGMNAAVGSSGGDEMPGGGPGGERGDFEGGGFTPHDDTDAGTDSGMQGNGRGFGGRGNRQRMSADGTESDMSQIQTEQNSEGQSGGFDGGMSENTENGFGGMPQGGFGGAMPDGSENGFGGMPRGDFGGAMSDGTESDLGGRGGFGGGGGMMMDSDESDNIFIYGGNIYVNAGGDGIDSNGYMYIYGGTVVVNQHGGGNAPLDSGLGIKFYGGTVLAAGSADMTETPEKADGSVPFVHFTAASPLSAGTEISIADSSGKTLITSTIQAAGQCVIFTSADVTEGETYTLIVNGSENTTAQAVLEEEGGGMNFGGGGMMGGRGGFGRMAEASAGSAGAGTVSADAPASGTAA